MLIGFNLGPQQTFKLALTSTRLPLHLYIDVEPVLNWWIHISHSHSVFIHGTRFITNSKLSDQLYRISGLEFYKWLSGPEKFARLSKNGPRSANDPLTANDLNK